MKLIDRLTYRFTDWLGPEAHAYMKGALAGVLLALAAGVVGYCLPVMGTEDGPRIERLEITRPVPPHRSPSVRSFSRELKESQREELERLMREDYVKQHPEDPHASMQPHRNIMEFDDEFPPRMGRVK